LIEKGGAPTLFVKHVKKSFCTFSASSFCNGSDSVSNVVSSIYRGHHWEGIAVNAKEAIEYRKRSTSLKDCEFKISASGTNDSETVAEKESIDNMHLRVTPLIIIQGTADWY